MSMINCPNCGAQVPAGAAFCDTCGASLAGVAARPAVGGLRCAMCGESVMPGEAFCGNCGAPQPAAAPAPAGQSFVPPLPPPPPPPPQPQSWSPPPAPQPQQGWPSQPPMPQPSSPPPPPIPAAVATCPNCGMPVAPNDVFCDNCGHALTPVPGFPKPEQKPAVESPWPPVESAWPPVAPAGYEPFASGPGAMALNPRLIVQSSGAILNMAGSKGEYVIGREDPVSGSFPEVDLVPYGGEEGGVSRRHAKITIRGGDYFIEDLNSVNYTYVNRQKLPAQVPHPLHDGDEVRLGRVVLQFKLS